MAMTRVPSDTVLRLELRTGTDENGNPVLRRKSLNNVKANAADQDIFDVALAVSGLGSNPLTGVFRIDSAALLES